MSKLRIVSDNAASRATLTASTTAGALVAANLLVDDKGSVWRATGTTASLTLTWPAPESITCVALPFCNLSSTATIRVRAYSDAAGSALILDTGAQLACPAPAVRLRGWTASQAASAYSYGGGAAARIWFGQVSVRRVVIDLADANNLQGYIEAACLVIGEHWAPTYNASTAMIELADTTELYRSDGGSQGAEAGHIYRRLQIELSAMPAADRAAFVNIVRNSRAFPVLVSLCHGASTTELERDAMVYGRRSKNSAVAFRYVAAYSTSIEIEEI